MKNRSAAPEYVDIHNHLLPAVDDGAGSLAESLRHLRAMADAGVSRLAVSSHLHGWVVREDDGLDRRMRELEAAFRRVRRACHGREGFPRLVFGQEILVADVDTADAVFADPRVGYRGTDYALIEFGFQLPDDPVAIIRAVKRHGRRPIVAHPERYTRDDTLAAIDEIAGWAVEGALLQVNAGSLLGRHGEGMAEHAWELLGRGLCDIIGTDHHGDSRPDLPDQVDAKLHERGAGHLARRLLCENPHRILRNRDTRRVEPWSPQAVA